MNRFALIVALSVAALACAGAARADVAIGIADDRGKYAEDGGRAFFATLVDLGVTENRVTVLWDPSRPSTIVDKPFLDRALPQARARGIRIVFAVYPARATGATESPDAPAAFAAYVELLARTYPQVKHFVIGNEPNQPRFWRPQFAADGTAIAAATFYPVLARSYDALKAVDPAIRVIGVGLSERGNDAPNAPSNSSTSPVRFMRDLGTAFRASGRTRPIMDELALHPYPESPQDALLRSYVWPSVGMGNLDRLKQAVWDAFAGTAQPTVEDGLRLRISETGWQVGVVASARHAYFGRENVAVTDEARQAQIYDQYIRHVACDPSIVAANIFGLFDEPDLDRFQAGLIRADGSLRPSYDALKNATAQTRGACATPTSWRHSKSVVGAGASFGKLATSWWRRASWSFSVTAAEESTYRAAIVRLPTDAARRRFAVRTLGTGRASSALAATGTVKAHWTPRVRFPVRRLRPGTYAYVVTLTAAMNPQRTSTFASGPFRVPAPPKRK